MDGVKGSVGAEVKDEEVGGVIIAILAYFFMRLDSK
jgi:hypothetical protein